MELVPWFEVEDRRPLHTAVVTGRLRDIDDARIEGRELFRPMCMHQHSSRRGGLDRMTAGSEETTRSRVVNNKRRNKLKCQMAVGGEQRW
jgi:hypothetical protein